MQSCLATIFAICGVGLLVRAAGALIESTMVHCHCLCTVHAHCATDETSYVHISSKHHPLDTYIHIDVVLTIMFRAVTARALHA